MDTTDNQKFVPKGWGHELWVVNTPLYCGKELFVKRGKKCSWHYHQKKDETFFLVSGEIILRAIHIQTLERLVQSSPLRRPMEFFLEGSGCRLHEITRLTPGSSFHVQTGVVHQFEAVVDSKLIEFSTEHFEEDSIRIMKGD